jgi:hypothetical protein
MEWIGPSPTNASGLRDYPWRLTSFMTDCIGQSILTGGIGLLVLLFAFGDGCSTSWREPVRHPGVQG